MSHEFISEIATFCFYHLLTSYALWYLPYTYIQYNIVLHGYYFHAFRAHYQSIPGNLKSEIGWSNPGEQLKLFTRTIKDTTYTTVPSHWV